MCGSESIPADAAPAPRERAPEGPPPSGVDVAPLPRGGTRIRVRPTLDVFGTVFFALWLLFASAMGSAFLSLPVSVLLPDYMGVDMLETVFLAAVTTAAGFVVWGVGARLLNRYRIDVTEGGVRVWSGPVPWPPRAGDDARRGERHLARRRPPRRLRGGPRPAALSVSYARAAWVTTRVHRALAEVRASATDRRPSRIQWVGLLMPLLLPLTGLAAVLVSALAHETPGDVYEAGCDPVVALAERARACRQRDETFDSARDLEQLRDELAFYAGLEHAVVFTDLDVTEPELVRWDDPHTDPNASFTYRSCRVRGVAHVIAMAGGAPRAPGAVRFEGVESDDDPLDREAIRTSGGGRGDQERQIVRAVRQRCFTEAVRDIVDRLAGGD